MNRLLKAKHWQIFMIIIGAPVILQAILTPFAMIYSENFLIMKMAMAISVIFEIGFILWYWSIAIGLQFSIPGKLKMNVTIFKVASIIQIIYTVGTLGVIVFKSDSLLAVIGNRNKMDGSSLAINLLSILCLFYCIYFVARTFKTVELQKKVIFSDFAWEFFLFLFFPVGVWIIQPKINNLVKKITSDEIPF
jgi:hypothetical protein